MRRLCRASGIRAKQVAPRSPAAATTQSDAGTPIPAIDIDIADWERLGYDVPLLVNLQPAGEYLGEAFHRAGGVPAVLWELKKAGKLNQDCLTCDGGTIGARAEETTDRRVVFPYEKPMMGKAGFLVMRGNIFDSAIMKTSVIDDEFRRRFLSHPEHPGMFEARAVVFDGSEDYHARLNDPALGIDEHSILVMREAGPVGWPGSAEVVNMQPPDALLKRGIRSLPTIGDGRQSGTSGSPSILHVTPEAALGAGLALVRTGVWMQVTAGSLTGRFGREARYFAEKNPELKLHELPLEQTK